MSEQEIRKIIRSVCADLDLRAKRAAQSTVRRAVLPAVMGVGLAISGCESTVIETGPGGQIVPQTDGAAQDGEPEAALGNDSAAAPLYAAPAPDAGPQVKYMAPLPDAGAIQPEYMAPMPDGALPTDAAASKDGAPYDAGPMVKYMAPQPDAGVVPVYAVPMYAVPMPK